MPSTQWKDLKWNFSAPLTETYIIDHYYPNIIETVLLRRPWSRSDENFIAIKDEIPLYESVSPSKDYRCVLGGDVYFDSRHIKSVKGPYNEKDGALKQKRSFIIDGFMQSTPFQWKTFEEVCPSYYRTFEWEGNEKTRLPYTDRLNFRVEVTENWQKYTRNGNFTCSSVIFQIMMGEDDYMWGKAGFTQKYVENINQKLIVNKDRCDGKDCIWHEVLWRANNSYLIWKDANSVVSVLTSTATNVKETLRIYPGRTFYGVIPGQDWPSFEFLSQEEDVGETQDNKYIKHTVTTTTTYS